MTTAATEIEPTEPLYPDVAWSSGHLLFGDRDLLEAKVRKKTLSASTMNGMFGCPAKQAASMYVRLPRDPFAPSAIGNGAHEVMEVFYRLPKAKRTRPAIDRIAAEAWPESPGGFRDTTAEVEAFRATIPADVLADWRKHVAEYAKMIFQLEDPKSIDVVATEQKWFSTVGDVKTFAAIDRLRRDENGRLVVDDFKFSQSELKPANSRFRDNYGEQQRMYVVVTENETGERPAAATLLYPLQADGKMGGRRDIDISDAALKNTVAGMHTAWKTINDSIDRAKFATNPGPLCAWCPLVNSCPVAKVTTEKGRQAAAEQPTATQLGIPTLRAGALPQEAARAAQEAVEAPTVPQSAAEPATAPQEALSGVIEPVGDDLFPVTIPDAQEQAHQVAPVFQLPVTAHVVDTSMNTATESENTMNPQMRAEAPPLEEQVNGRLNLNSFSAQAVTGLVAKAFDHLEQQKQPVSPNALTAFTDVLAGIVLRTQRQLTGSTSWQAGAQTRLRGLLFSYLSARPAPFGQNADVWVAWVNKAERFLAMSLTTADALHDRKPVENDSYLFFASNAQGGTQ